MINELTIRNFQSHQKTILKFHPGVNVIVGATDSGKTSIMRALRWLIFNRPSGDAFRSSWGGNTSVSLLVDDKVVKRVKSKTSNSYLIDKSKFSAFGTGVPEEVQTVLNINENNIQTQLDPPFLLSKSSGEVAQHFNKIADLEDISKATKNIKKWSRDIEKDINVQEHNISTFETRLKSEFENFDKLEIEVEVLEQLNKWKTDAVRKRINLSSLISEVEEINNTLSGFSHILTAEKKVNLLLKLREELSELHDDIFDIEEKITELVDVDEQIEGYQLILTDAPQIGELLDMSSQQRQTEKDIQALATILNSLSKIKKQIDWNKKEVIKLQEDFDDQFPEICPLCDTLLIDSNHATH